MSTAIGPRILLATPSYLRLWVAGGFGNSMRWLEMLVAGIYTFDVTGSAFWVAVVTVVLLGLSAVVVMLAVFVLAVFVLAVFVCGTAGCTLIETLP